VQPKDELAAGAGSGRRNGGSGGFFVTRRLRLLQGQDLIQERHEVVDGSTDLLGPGIALLLGDLYALFGPDVDDLWADAPGR
jgi:hypothetical protein